MPSRSTSVQRLATTARALATSTVVCLSFFSRLPLPSGFFGPGRNPALADALGALPLAGLIVGSCGALPLIVANRLGLPDGLAAALGLTGGILASGGLHEDGLADMADGFGGGSTRERKLAIMRDSRIGTYGVLALVLSLLIRIACLATLLGRSGVTVAVAAMLGASAVSRALAVLPLATLPPARTDGLGQSAGRPSARVMATCLALAASIGLLLPAWAGNGVKHAAMACTLAALASLVVIRLAKAHIGGQTGDVGGASQQASEIGYMIGLLIAPDLT